MAADATADGKCHITLVLVISGLLPGDSPWRALCAHPRAARDAVSRSILGT